ncbi:peptidoglycan editing factor PgeF [Haloimpatiens lingqiaonensis]|uniref:peptidoglycan editing factor PgeF n=1 Tax=Haloimpatiens lingqiaonensis TaxID=1380675 RepID=UPI0010FE09DE|nr:peptidoglycan editing factor PgeF [Haloimpatiens lingqiaonensis]
MLIKNIGQYKFIGEESEDLLLYFSTANGELNFNKNTSEGIKNLKNIKEWFNADNVGYLNQTHSNIIVNYDGKIHEGDAIITNSKLVAIGVFTADCVPIVMFDKNKKVIAAVHSGWKGTYNFIVSKVIKNMMDKYSIKSEDIIVYVGPHIGKCCYKVGEDLLNNFKNVDIYGEDVTHIDKLDLTACIKKQCLNSYILEENIHILDLCTFCDEKNQWFSYRKSKTSNRMFSFIMLKK